MSTLAAVVWDLLPFLLGLLNLGLLYLSQLLFEEISQFVYAALTKRAVITRHHVGGIYRASGSDL